MQVYDEIALIICVTIKLKKKKNTLSPFSFYFRGWAKREFEGKLRSFKQNFTVLSLATL